MEIMMGMGMGMGLGRGCWAGRAIGDSISDI